LLGEWLKEKLGEEGNYIVLGIPRGGVRALGKSAPAPSAMGRGRSMCISASGRGALERISYKDKDLVPISGRVIGNANHNAVVKAYRRDRFKGNP